MSDNSNCNCNQALRLQAAIEEAMSKFGSDIGHPAFKLLQQALRDNLKRRL